MFPSLNILQHYAKFNNLTIVMLEKLIGVGSFGGSIDHLVHHETTIHASLDEINFPFMV